MGTTFFFTLIVVLHAFTVQAHTAGNQPAMTGASSFTDYEFIAPEGWQVQRNSDHLRIQNMGSGCLILIFPPQNSSGNLEQDATAVFETMYKGWQFQRTGRQQYVLSKGFLPKGLPYYMLEAPMSKLSADGVLTMRRRGAGDGEHARVRIEDVNYGGTGWTARLCMLKTDVEGGKEYEVCYGRQDR
jgi:hypothetical protein